MDFLISLLGASSSSSNVLAILTSVAALLGLGLAFMKLRPEKDNIAASAAKTAVEVFNATVKSLQDDLIQTKAELATQEQLTDKVDAEGERFLRTVERERDAAIAESNELRGKIFILEKRLRALSSGKGERP